MNVEECITTIIASCSVLVILYLLFHPDQNDTPAYIFAKITYRGVDANYYLPIHKLHPYYRRKAIINWNKLHDNILHVLNDATGHAAICDPIIVKKQDSLFKDKHEYKYIRHYKNMPVHRTFQIVGTVQFIIE